MKWYFYPQLLIGLVSFTITEAWIDSDGDLAPVQSRRVKLYSSPQDIIITDAMEKYRLRREGTAKISGTIKASIKLGLNSKAAHTFLQKDVLTSVLAKFDVHLFLESACKSKVLLAIAQPKLILGFVKILKNADLTKVTIPPKVISKVSSLPIASVFLTYLKNLSNLKVLFNGGLNLKLFTVPVIKFISTLPFLTNFLKVVHLQLFPKALFQALSNLKLFDKINPNVVIKICLQILASNPIKLLLKSKHLIEPFITKIFHTFQNAKILEGILSAKVILRLINPELVLKIFNLAIIKNILNPEFTLKILNNGDFIKAFIKPTLLADIFGSSVMKIVLSTENIAKLVASVLMQSLLSGGALKLLLNGVLGLGLNLGMGAATKGAGELLKTVPFGGSGDLTDGAGGVLKPAATGAATQAVPALLKPVKPQGFFGFG